MSSSIVHRNMDTRHGQSLWHKAVFAVLLTLLIGSVIDWVTSSACSDLSAEDVSPNAQRQNARFDQKSGSVPDADDPKLAAFFSGSVVDLDGEPLSRARIFVVPLIDDLNRELAILGDTNKLVVRTETDADGRFEFDAPDMTFIDLDGLPTRRRCLVIATADGYAPDWIERWGRTRASFVRDPVKGSDLTLQLEKDDVPIHGQLVDADGSPVVGAHVQLTGLMIPLGHDLDAHLDDAVKSSVFSMPRNFERELHQPSLLPGLTTETRTDSEGQFTFSGLGRERLASIQVTAPDVVDTTLHVMTREGPDIRIRLGGGDASIPRDLQNVIHAAEFSAKLERGRTIRGVVRDRDTQNPIPGILVGVGSHNSLPQRTRDENYQRDGVLSHATVTDAQGRFAISGLSWSPSKWTITAASAPGMPYQSAAISVVDDSPVVIECPRGIPFRLKVVDEQGNPVAAEVTYNDVLPNSHAPKPFCYPCRSPLSQASRIAEGTYQGFVIPGPGAVLVKAIGRRDYLPAYVDPKAFFAPDRTDWTASDLLYAYGTKDTVSTSMGAWDQNDFAAIILVDPAPDSSPLELTATMKQSKSRSVSLIDTDGNPVAGCQTQGMTEYPYDTEPPLRAATFSLNRLHPNRIRRITFYASDRQLVGFLSARGDSDLPCTVQMQRWATVSGRILAGNGKPLSIEIHPSNAVDLKKGELENANFRALKTDDEGRFRIDQLIPGTHYTGEGWRDLRSVGKVFERLVMAPGEIRDLGDIRMTAPQSTP